MMQVDVEMFFSVGVAVLALLIGYALKAKFHVLKRFCIPAPIVGGLIIAVGCLFLYLADFAFSAYPISSASTATPTEKNMSTSTCIIRYHGPRR